MKIRQHCFLLPRLLLSLAALSATLLQPVNAVSIPEPLVLPAGNVRNSGAVTFGQHGSIDAVTFSPDELLPAFVLSEPVGENYTLTFWVRVDESPLLQEKHFTDKTPVTLVEFIPKERRNAQEGMIIRMIDGKFAAVEQNKGNWKTLWGFDIRVVPDTWYFLAYVRTPAKGVFYINGDRITITRDEAVRHSLLQSLTLGHMNGLRAFSGQMLDVNLYSEALSDAQIKALSRQVPTKAASR